MADGRTDRMDGQMDRQINSINTDFKSIWFKMSKAVLPGGTARNRRC